jgi:hypothetical protein
MATGILTIQLKQSVWLRNYLWLLHSFFFIITATLPMEWLWRGGLCFLVLFSFLFYYRAHYLLTGRCNVRKLIRSGDETWTIYYGDGRCVKERVLQQCVVIPQLVILYFKTTPIWKTRSVYITADQVDSELFRQLRVYCREPKTFQR